jgi:ABC-type uncharacterized transport system substrate-binding protein
MLRWLFAILIAWHAGAANADVILLLSDSKPSVLGVAQALRNTYSGRIETFNLGGDRGNAADKVGAIQSSPIQQVVAIGLLAAQVARQQLSSKQVVFCQVLNYDDFDLTTSWMKGVSALPSMRKQFEVWKALNPNLKRVGVVTSKQMWESIADNVEEDAHASGIELVHLEAGSDREVMAALRRAGQIHGLWLAPDSRVLSTAVILEMVSYATRQNIQVLGFSPSLLKEGALLSGTTDAAEIARVVLARLKQAQGASAIPGEPVLPLSSANVSINGGLAARLGLTVNDKVKGMANVE